MLTATIFRVKDIYFHPLYPVVYKQLICAADWEKVMRIQAI